MANRDANNDNRDRQDRRSAYGYRGDEQARSRYDRSRYGSSASHEEGSGQRESVNLWDMAGESRSRYSSRYAGDKRVDSVGGAASGRATRAGQAAGTASAASAASGSREARDASGMPVKEVPAAAEAPADDGARSNFERYSRRAYENRSSAGRLTASARGSHATSPTPRAAGGRSDGAVASHPARRRVLLAIVGVLAAALLVGAGVAFAYVNSIASNLNAGVDQDLRDSLAASDMGREPFYMLLMGTDGSAERDAAGDLGGVYRSDSMMLARIDVPNKKATLISINRDTAVDLGQYGRQKINAAYGLGGPALAVEAVSNLLGVKISHYAQVDFDGFSALVDALGGVEVDVPVEIDDPYAGGYVAAGLQTLDGTEALILCRSRETYVDSAHPDQMRAANQRLVISAIAKKLLGSDLPTIAASVSAISRYATTDLALNDIIGLAQLMRGLDPSSDIYTSAVPTTSQYVDDVWYEFLDQKAWNAMKARMEQGLAPNESAVIDEATGTVMATAGEGAQDTSTKYASVTVKNGTNRQGLATAARTALMSAGFVNVMIGDVAEGYSYPETLVVYESAGQAREAEQIVEVLGQGETFLNDGSYLVVDTDFVVIIGDDWKS